MKLTLHKPDLTKPKVAARCREFLKLATELETFGPKRISSIELTQRLGNQAQPLGAWLRLGLERYGSYSVERHLCYFYRPVPEFVAALRRALPTETEPVTQVAARLNKTFTTAVKRADMKRTGSRVYAWWTNLPSTRLVELFVAQFGQMHRYDIEVSRPTIILQLYNRAVSPIAKKHSARHQVSTWTAYVNDRTSFRHTLATDCGITTDEVKDILQGITNGTYASTSPRNRVCKKIGVVSTTKLMMHPLYIGLRTDFKVIRKTLLGKSPAKEAQRRLYFAYEKIEDAIMTLVDNELKVPAWFIHDGFFTATEVDKTRLEKLINTKLGFNIKLEHTAHYKPEAR